MADSSGGASRHFGEPWLESCCQSTLLPTSSWQRVSRLLANGLAARIKALFAKDTSAPSPSTHRFYAALRELVGNQFYMEYFPALKYDYDREVLNSLPPHERKQLISEANTWLHRALAKVYQDNAEQMAEPMLDFTTQAQSILRIGFDRHLYHQERNKLAREQIETPQEPKPKANLKTGKFLRSLPHKADVTSEHSERIGRSVVALLERQPKHIESVCKTLLGRPLPSALRAYLWQEMLYKDERRKVNDSNVETLLRERFGRGLSKQLHVTGQQRATSSEVSRLIHSSVLRVYESHPSLEMSEEHLSQAIKVLNILYTYDGTYEPALIYWLYPLQIAFEPTLGRKSGDEHLYELAMFLDLLNNNVFPNSLQIYAMAEQVFDILERRDPELYDQLKLLGSSEVVDESPAQPPKPSTPPNRPAFTAPGLASPATSGGPSSGGTSGESSQAGGRESKDFMAEVLLNEQIRANELLERKREHPTSPPGRIKTDPVLYLRKWISEGFVSALNPSAILFVWDQLFLADWHSTVVRDLSLALILLLRPRFITATHVEEVKAAFMRGPSALLTADIQQAYQVTRAKGIDADISDVPYLNRLKPPLVLDPSALADTEDVYTAPRKKHAHAQKDPKHRKKDSNENAPELDVLKSPKDKVKSPRSDGDVKSPKSKDKVKSPRSDGEVKSPKSKDKVKSPRSKEKVKSPRSDDDVKSPKSKGKVKSPRSDGEKAPKTADASAPPKQSKANKDAEGEKAGPSKPAKSKGQSEEPKAGPPSGDDEKPGPSGVDNSSKAKKTKKSETPSQ